jgi:hypothetical protein
VLADGAARRHQPDQRDLTSNLALAPFEPEYAATKRRPDLAPPFITDALGRHRSGFVSKLDVGLRVSEQVEPPTWFQRNYMPTLAGVVAVARRRSDAQLWA